MKGWYLDPWKQAPLRWWDGAQWTSRTSWPREWGTAGKGADREPAVQARPVAHRDIASDERKSAIVKKFVSVLAAHGFKFRSDEFRHSDVQSVLNKHLPEPVRKAADRLVDEKETLLEEGAVFGVETIISKTLLDGLDAPFIKPLANMFATHEVDFEVVDAVLQRLNALSMFSCIRYRECMPELFVCVDADRISLADACDFASIVDSINSDVLSPTAKNVAMGPNWFGINDKLRQSFSRILFTYFDQSNPAVTSSILERCKRTHNVRPQYTLPWVALVDQRKVLRYRGWPPEWQTKNGFNADSFCRGVFGS